MDITKLVLNGGIAGACIVIVFIVMLLLIRQTNGFLAHLEKERSARDQEREKEREDRKTERESFVATIEKDREPIGKLATAVERLCDRVDRCPTNNVGKSTQDVRLPARTGR